MPLSEMKLEVLQMENRRINPWVMIGVIASIAAIIASLTTAVLMLDKKRKDDEELERYLDCSIQ